MSEPTSKTYNLKANEIPFANQGLEAPTIYAEDIRGVSVSNGVAKLTLIENRVNVKTGEIFSVVVANLVVPHAMVVNWGPFMTKTFNQTAEVAEEAGPEGGQGEHE